MDNATILRALNEGKPVPAEDLITLRSKGMHEIRFELILGLIHRGEALITISVYWEDEHEFMLKPYVEDKSRKLIFGRGKRVTAEFPDMWLLRYPHDAKIKNIVDRMIEKMVSEALNRLAAEAARINPVPPKPGNFDQSDKVPPYGSAG